MPTSPNGSGHSDGTATTDAFASSSASSRAPTQPLKSTRCCTPRRRASLRIEANRQPSPQITNSASTARAARIRTATPLGATTRPANTTRRRSACPEPLAGGVVLNSGTTARRASAVRGEVAVDGARVADREVGALERRESAAGAPVGSGQRLRDGACARSLAPRGWARTPARGLACTPGPAGSSARRRCTPCNRVRSSPPGRSRAAARRRRGRRPGEGDSPPP